MSKAKIYNLPRGYLSHSQVVKVEENPEGYVREYLYGEKRGGTVYMDFGSVIAEALDGKNDHVGGNLIKDFIPQYPKSEVEIRCILTRKGKKLELMGRLDCFNPRKHAQGERKTGTKPWTQKQADKSLQLKIYALIHYKNTGKIPAQELTWMGTEFHGGELRLTGDFKTFHVKQTLKDILETEARVWRAYDAIIKLVEREYENI